MYKKYTLWLSRFCLIIIFLTFGLASNAQTYFFDNYSTQQEFESKVYCIILDSNHYAWLGTPSGVWKFDGKLFINYSVDNGLAEGSVRSLFIDNNKTTWLGHEGGGLTRYINGSFEKIIVFDSILNSNITSINQDKEDNLWITTESDGALVIYNPGQQSGQFKYEHYLKGKSLGDQVFSSLFTNDGNLFFITNAGIRKYNKKDNSFESYLPKGLFTYFSISVMFEDSKGNLWFGTYNGGLSKLNFKDKSIQYFNTSDGLASNWVTSVAEDKSGNIWVGHWKDAVNTGGITKIETSGNIKTFNTSNGLHDERIWCIVEDFEGNLLIGTTDQGLEIFKGEKFVSYTTQNGLVHNLVNAITEGSKGEIWFGTNKGITVISAFNKAPSVQLFNQNNKFISDQISFFKKDNNNIWIGTSDQGVLMYNITKQRFASQPTINSYVNYFQTITGLEITKNGVLWIGTIGALIGYDIKNEKYIGTFTQGSGLAGNEISALFVDSKDNLWIGAGKNKGLTRMHNQTFTIIDKVGEITPTCITEDKKGRIWIGTDIEGIIVIENDSIIKTYSTEDGLLSKHINLLYCDPFNNIYAGTNLGLNKIDQKNNKIVSYSKRVGFTGIETKQNAWFIDSKGFLWIGTANGAMRCNLDLLATERRFKPLVQINEMLVKNLHSEMTDHKRFKSNENDISFKFGSINFTNPEGISYKTMLQGYDDGWQDQKNENIKVYTKLPPGKYIFNVKAKNEYGEWSENPDTYSFRILAPPYKRGYFIISVICIILASIIAYIKIRERNLVEEKKVLEAKVSERTQALQVANKELSMKNKDILDSITYAKRIQLAILPSDIIFTQTFILYKPKDIVSGDFYWMYNTGNKEFLTAVDCTGHGVPGAFMSFIGFTSLNKIIIEQKIYKPSDILNRLNEEVATTLHQKGETIVNDGMDIALICYTPDTGILEYSGAFNPLIIVRKGEIIEIKADRFAIGHSTEKVKSFTNHEIKMENDDSVYLFSDGYADQFGGPEGKKFKTSALKDLFVSISSLNAEQKQKALDDAFEKWRTDQEQIDDVLVLGRKF